MKLYNFQVTESVIQSISGNNNFLALGGYDEVIRLFDVANRRDLGSLVGEHTGTITALQFHSNKYMLSGSEDSSIIIWRCQDWSCLHKLQIINKSKILDLSVHPSGKMLLALYDNAVLRLWNLMSARCQYKKKLGLVEEMEVLEEGEDGGVAETAVKADDDDIIDKDDHGFSSESGQEGAEEE